MAESRLLIITSGMVGSGFSLDVAAELAEAGLADVLDTARTLPRGYSLRTSVDSRREHGHISGEHLVQLFDDGFSSGAGYVCVLGDKRATDSRELYYGSVRTSDTAPWLRRGGTHAFRGMLPSGSFSNIPSLALEGYYWWHV